ncbi:MAG: NAD-dependent epimerase/dehydratase family protein, partial [Gammaproteobacteria bacterium]|nr:NAD-dependent epimerase/dehydratase family protein [Gammaproteobacteria bacterium]
MKVLIAGATGFIGKALARAFILRGDQVIVLGRSKAKMKFVFEEPITLWTWIDLETHSEPIDLIVNLSGENIGGWWSKKKKEKILNSRLAAIKRLIAYCNRQKETSEKSPRLLQASGIGIYGIRGDRVYDENSPLPE